MFASRRLLQGGAGCLASNCPRPNDPSPVPEASREPPGERGGFTNPGIDDGSWFELFAMFFGFVLSAMVVVGICLKQAGTRRRRRRTRSGRRRRGTPEQPPLVVFVNLDKQMAYPIDWSQEKANPTIDTPPAALVPAVQPPSRLSALARLQNWLSGRQATASTDATPSTAVELSTVNVPIIPRSDNSRNVPETGAAAAAQNLRWNSNHPVRSTENAQVPSTASIWGASEAVGSVNAALTQHTALHMGAPNTADLSQIPPVDEAPALELDPCEELKGDRDLEAAHEWFAALPANAVPCIAVMPDAGICICRRSSIDSDSREEFDSSRSSSDHTGPGGVNSTDSSRRNRRISGGSSSNDPSEPSVVQTPEGFYNALSEEHSCSFGQPGSYMATFSDTTGGVNLQWGSKKVLVYREHAPVLQFHTPSSSSDQSDAAGGQTGDNRVLQGHADRRAQTDNTAEGASSSSAESPSRDSRTGNEEESVRDSLEGRGGGRVQGVGVGEENTHDRDSPDEVLGGVSSAYSAQGSVDGEFMSASEVPVDDEGEQVDDPSTASAESGSGEPDSDSSEEQTDASTSEEPAEDAVRYFYTKELRDSDFEHVREDVFAVAWRAYNAFAEED